MQLINKVNQVIKVCRGNSHKGVSSCKVRDPSDRVKIPED